MKRTLQVWISCSAVLFFLIVGSPLQAQTGFGAISGSITDNSGAPVPGVSVKARNLDTNVTTDTVTSTDGIYNILSLVPGNYNLTAQKTGFDRSDAAKVIVSTGQTTTVNISLKVGQVTTTVEVSAQTSMLNSNTMEVSTTIQKDLLSEMPYTERNVLEATMLVPGVRGDPNSYGQVFNENPGIYTANVAPGAGTNISGGMPGSAAILVDGANVTQASLPRTALSVSGPMTQEVTVITNGVPAKYGNAGGAVIIQATRSGTNQLHGQLEWRHNDPAFNAEPLGNTIPNEQHQNWFGMYGGGPVWIPKVYNGRNKTFFYGGFEPARLFNNTTLSGTLPTPDELAGNFANAYSLINTNILSTQGLAAALAAPRTGGLYYQSPLNSAGFPVGPQYTSTSQYVPIPNLNLSTQLAENKFAQYVMSQQPTPSNPGPFTQFLLPSGLWNNLGYNVSLIRGVTNVDNRYSFRIDHQISSNDRLFVRYSAAPVTSVRFEGYPLNSVMTNIPSDQSWANNGSVGETHVITPSMVNEFKVIYARNKQARGEAPASLGEDYAAKYGLTPATNGAGFPHVSWSSYTLGPGTTSISGQTDVNFQLADDITWTKGRHTIAFGLDMRRQESNQRDASGLYGGSYSFGTGQTNNGSGGNALASFDLGLISSFSNTPVQVPAYYRWHYWGGYLQDDIKLKSKLTLNVGVRYEVQTPRIEKYNNQGTFIPNLTGTLNGQAATGAYCFSGSCGLPTSLWPTNYMGFEPRIGIGWAATPKMTVRVNYGLMRVPLTGYGNTPSPDFNVASTSVGGTSGGVNPNQPVDYITNPVGPLTSALSALQGKGPFFTVQGVTIPYVSQSNTVPYVQQYALTLQYQLDSRTVLQLGYSGMEGTHLISIAAPPLNFPNLNTLGGLIASNSNFSSTNIKNPYNIVTVGTTSVINENLLSSLNPYQNFFNQSLLTNFYREGVSNYQSLPIGVTRRLTNGLTVQASFTWSKSIDDTGGSYVIGQSGSIYGTATVQNPFNLKQEKAVSNFDAAVKYTMGYSYQVPTGKGHYLSTHNRIGDEIIGGWSTSGVFNAQDGMPFVPTLGSAGYYINSSGTSALPTGIQLRPNVVPGKSCFNSAWSASNPFAVPYLNWNAFSVPGSLGNPQLGDAPRTMTDCRSPAMEILNASLTKKINITERVYLQLQLQTLNTTNHPLFFFNPNTGSKAYNGFSTASLTNPAVPAFTNQSTFGIVNQPNSALMSRVALVSIKLFF
jgi:hypothetical protein